MLHRGRATSSLAILLRRSCSKALFFSAFALVWLLCACSDAPDDVPVGQTSASVCAVSGLQQTNRTATSVELSATANCAAGEVPQYLFQFYRDGVGPWTNIGTLGWSTQNRVTWNFGTPPSGRYILQVQVRRGTGPVDSTYTQDFFIGKTCSGLGGYADPPGAQTPNSAVFVWTSPSCSSGGEAELQYSAKGPGEADYSPLVNGWVSGTTLVWFTTNRPVGQYSIRVRARAKGNPSTYEAQLTLPYVLRERCSSVSVTTSPPSPQQQATRISMSATATCSNGQQAQYQFYYQPATGGTKTVFRAWNTTNSATLDTNRIPAGNYRIGADARVNGSTGGAEATQSASYTLSPLRWTSRDVYTLRNVAWASYRNLNATELQANYQKHKAEGMIPINLGGRSGYGNEYSIVWRENVDGRRWEAHWGLTSDQYHTLWQQYRDQGLRPLGVTSYLFGGLQLWAGIWIENRENLGWISERGMTSAEYEAFYNAQVERGYRPIDMDAYSNGSDTRFAAIWYQNVDDLSTYVYRGMSRDQYNARVDQMVADGYLMIDYDEYDGGDEHTAIWEKPAQLPSHWIRTNRGERDFANIWRAYRDEGYRPIYVQHHGDEFGGIWIENDDDRFHYARKGQIDQALLNYWVHNTSGLGSGMSLAVIHQGKMIYRKGAGFAGDDKVAHGETIYNAASVSKVIGGSLAAKIEANDKLYDSTPAPLDMRTPTRTLLPTMPVHHSHLVQDLTAHLGCVAHYDTDPEIDDQSSHYGTALSASQSFWGTGLVNNCAVGLSRSYSTPAFTLLGAVLEKVSGRNIHELIETEISRPYGLTSLRSRWRTGSVPDDYDRAEPYGENTTWKVLGGGLELHAVDLARFGWLVLDGQFVTPYVRDNRLFKAVAPQCNPPIPNPPERYDGICENGVAWRRYDMGSGRIIVEHNGKSEYARSWIRLYRNQGLVVAFMSNTEEHNPEPLVTQVADIVLAP